jgi:putative membrane protein
MHKSVKALTLLGLALFLQSRLVNGKILFYISHRFVALTWLAVLSLILLTTSYHVAQSAQRHKHRLTWKGLALVLLPIVLGVLVPPQPLGTAALSNRGLKAGPRALLALSSRGVRQATEQHRPTILDWALTFNESPDPATFKGQKADVTGFVYQHQDLPPETWTVNRFVVTCCVADAIAVGLVVRASDTAPPVDDQWVRIQGHFITQTLDAEPIPVLLAETITLIDPPDQPYLYYR